MKLFSFPLNLFFYQVQVIRHYTSYLGISYILSNKFNLYSHYIMARPGKLLRQFEELKKKQSEYFSKHKMLEGMQLQPKIDAIKQELLEIDRREEERKYQEIKTLRDLLPRDEVERNNIHKLLVKVSLASDFLYDCLLDLEKQLDKLGILVNSFSDETRSVVSASNALASKLITDRAPKLSEVLLDDMPMIESLHDILNSYVDKTLKL